MGGSGCSVCWSLALFSILILEVSPVGLLCLQGHCCLLLAHLAVTSGSSSQTMGYRYPSSPGQPFTDGSPILQESLCTCGLALYCECLPSIGFQLQGDCHQILPCEKSTVLFGCLGGRGVLGACFLTGFCKLGFSYVSKSCSSSNIILCSLLL